MATTSMLKNRYFDDDDDDDDDDASSTASIRTEDDHDNVTTVARGNHHDPTLAANGDDEAAIAAQYAKKLAGGGRQGVSSSGLHHSSTGGGGSGDPKRRKVDSRPKVTMETILDPTYGIAQLVTNLPTRMKSVTPDHRKTTMSTAAAKKYMNALLQSYYDVIMNDWLRIPSLTASSATTASSACSNLQQQLILQDVFYRVETLGMNKGPLKDAITSLRHVHCRNPLLYDAIGIRRANTILQQYEQEQELQLVQHEQNIPTNENCDVTDPTTGVDPVPYDTLRAPVPESPSFLPASTTAATATLSDNHASSLHTGASTGVSLAEQIEIGHQERESLSSPPEIVPLTSHKMNDEDDDDDEVMTPTVTPTNQVQSRNQKRRYILEDSDEDE